MPPAFVAGVTAPEYGMTTCGTPIGLPGPPHIPLGIPAGLQQHVITNHTAMHIPGPVQKVQSGREGRSRATAIRNRCNGMTITERSYTPPAVFHQPFSDRREHVEDIPDGECQRECEQ